LEDLKKDVHFFLQKHLTIFIVDIKKDIFFFLLDPRLSVKKRVGVCLALIHFLKDKSVVFSNGQIMVAKYLSKTMSKTAFSEDDD
jgi:hypothetical protein